MIRLVFVFVHLFLKSPLPGFVFLNCCSFWSLQAAQKQAKNRKKVSLFFILLICDCNAWCKICGQGWPQRRMAVHASIVSVLFVCWNQIRPDVTVCFCQSHEQLLDLEVLDSRDARSTHLFAALYQPVASSVHFFPCCFSATQSPDDEAPSTAEVDLFMSTQRIKVLNADTQV